MTEQIINYLFGIYMRLYDDNSFSSFKYSIKHDQSFDCKIIEIANPAP